jgi:hypothetical protein
MTPEKLDPNKLARDCGLVKEIVAKHPVQIQSLVAAAHRAMSDKENRFGEVDRIAKEIGINEEAFVAKGGGFFFLIVRLALGAAGCMAHCGHPPTRTAVDVRNEEK